jgi:glycosyltransferase involved in cell wall biosynthesis
MKLLYICDALAIFGGQERVLIEKANWLVEHGGFEVCLLTVNQGNHPVCFPLHQDVSHEDLDIRFYEQYHLSFWRRVIKSRELHRLFREHLKSKIQEKAPDIIICTRIDYIRDVIKMKGHVPLVFESHSSCLSSRFDGDGLLRRFHVWYLQQAVKKADMIVSLTKGDAEEWNKLTPKVCVIPNVVRLNESGLYSGCTGKSVIYVGRFSKQKDVGSLLRIWNLVYQRHPDWCLHIYGGYGEEQDALLAEIKQKDVNIKIHEATSAIFEKYKQCSILILTSRYEPFGLVLPEAMSCGLPVVAFDCPYGPADIISDGKDGFLVMNRNDEVFAEKVCLLIEKLELRISMGMAGVLSSRRYEASLIMSEWLLLFEKLMSKE